MQKSQAVELINTHHALFKPRPKMSPVSWCESQFSLSTISSNSPGRYSTAVTPYVREIIDTIGDPNIEACVLCFGTQVSKTQAFMACLGWMLVNEPCPAMWVMPNKQLAQSFSDTRLQPFLFSSSELCELKPRDRFAIKLTEMKLDMSLLTLIGSNSPSNLSSRPVRLLVLDEVDKFPQKTKREANALALALERTRTFSEPKVLESSTPTTVDGQIWQDFLNGDQRRYFVPCPHCKEFIVLTLTPDKSVFERRMGCEARLEWSQSAKREDGTWDYAEVEGSAHFVCPYCKGKIYDYDKTKMLRAGEWRPTNAEYCDPKIRSYHMPSFYAPWKKTSWGILAVDFLKEKKSLSGLKNYINSICAEPDIGQFDGKSFMRRELILSPDEVESAFAQSQSVRILTSDVQKDHLYYLVREWGKGGHSNLIEWGKVDNFDELRDAQLRLQVKDKFVGVDSGFEASDVYKECARYGWRALRGDDKESWSWHDKTGKRVERPYTVRHFDPMLGTADQGRKRAAEMRWSNPFFKDVLARLRDKTQSPVRFGIVQTYATEEYFKQMDAEYKRPFANPKTGKVKHVWMLRSKHWPNHLFDCECMNVAFATSLNILKTQESEK